MRLRSWRQAQGKYSSGPLWLCSVMRGIFRPAPCAASLFFRCIYSGSYRAAPPVISLYFQAGLLRSLRRYVAAFSAWAAMRPPVIFLYFNPAAQLRRHLPRKNPGGGMLAALAAKFPCLKLPSRSVSSPRMRVRDRLLTYLKLQIHHMTLQVHKKRNEPTAVKIGGYLSAGWTRNIRSGVRQCCFRFLTTIFRRHPTRPPTEAGGCATLPETLG
jgi:hypothetical protein